MQGMSTSTPKDHLEQHDDLSRKDVDVALLLFSTSTRTVGWYKPVLHGATHDCDLSANEGKTFEETKTQDVKTTRQRQTQATWCTQVMAPLKENDL